MACKSLLVLLLIIAYVSSAHLPVHPVADNTDEHKDEHHHPKYTYKYGVEDSHSGDMKSQHEERDGDVVKGEYTVVQPDGKTRVVSYATDEHSGFHAIVTYIDLSKHEH